jgi:NADH-quinone oxidoreductase subunit C
MTEQAQMPADAGTDELADRVRAALGDILIEAETLAGELVVHVARDMLVEAMSALRDDAGCRFKQLMDIAGVDYPGRAERFEVVYNLLSLALNQRLRVIISTDENTAVPSIAAVWLSVGTPSRKIFTQSGDSRSRV